MNLWKLNRAGAEIGNVVGRSPEKKKLTEEEAGGEEQSLRTVRCADEKKLFEGRGTQRRARTDRVLGRLDGCDPATKKEDVRPLSSSVWNCTIIWI